MSAAGKFMEWLSNPKDASVSYLLEKVLRDHLERYGQVLELKLDSRQCTLRVQLLLKGERDPITVYVDEYQLISEPASTAVVIKRAVASRAWITTMLEEFVLGRRFSIPDKYASLSKMIF